MVILFIGKPTISLQVELKQLLASSPPCFFILVWLMNSERSVMATTEHRQLQVEHLVQTRPMTFKPRGAWWHR